MKLIDRIIALAELWAAVSDRSVATLATRVARDGKLIDRLRDGRNCNVETAERFFAFFRDPVSWPEDMLPADAVVLLDDVSLGHRLEAAE